MENQEKNFPSEQEKPKILYHASSNVEVKDFEPRAESYRDPDEGPTIFATPDKAYASMFIVPVDDRWAQIATLEGVNCIVISDRGRFEKLDKGGAIYSLPSKNFECDSEKYKTNREWTIKTKVNPNDKDLYKSGLEAMMENGVQVYFVDQPTFEKIKKAEDYGASILKNIQSENQKLGKNIIGLPPNE